ncbi:conserved Plasmodium protein, unknown function [Plasmodium ovale]|uniref:Uncharacterized protein n=1 Tax=Plasmodium ovale TaxID=36330 RepID=A0A1D3KXM8_PLAOA|nr:conserved Plasmodium protein, unknown function [Plasmodium ovale]
MIELRCMMKHVKNVLEFFVLILTYVGIFSILCFYCLMKKVKDIIKCNLCFKLHLRKSFHNFFYKCTLENGKKKCKMLFFTLMTLFKKENNKKRISLKKKMKKTPKHIYIVLKMSDIVMLNKRKLLNYILNIVICLYERKIPYVTIYVADTFFNVAFYDDLTQSLYEHNFFMNGVIKGGSGDSGGARGSYSNRGEGCALLIPPPVDEFVVTKFTCPLKDISIGKEKRKSSKTYYTYEKFSLHLKFTNKSNSHDKLIDIAERSNVSSEGQPMTGEKLLVCNKNVEAIIKTIFDFDRNEFYRNYNKEKWFIRALHRLSLFWRLVDVAKGLPSPLSGRLFCMLRGKFPCVFLPIYEIGEIIMLCTRWLLKGGYTYQWGRKRNKKEGREKGKKTGKQKERQAEEKEYRESDFSPKGQAEGAESAEGMATRKDGKGKENSLEFLCRLFDKSTLQKDESMETMKSLIRNNIPLYVKPLYEDIFGDDFEKIFNYTPVDVVLSLRVGLKDYLLSTLICYKTQNCYYKNNFRIFQNFRSYFVQYCSSFFFLYSVVHPFQKNGIQPWVLSDSELYEFYSYSVRSVKKALDYYSASMQRYGT